MRVVESVMEGSDRPMRREVAALVFHGGAMAERGGPPEQGLACAMAFGFGQFRAQIKAGTEGSSPRGFPANGGHRKMACGGKDSTLPLSNGGREIQGAV
jgi:hypothetical protein